MDSKTKQNSCSQLNVITLITGWNPQASVLSSVLSGSGFTPKQHCISRSSECETPPALQSGNSVHQDFVSAYFTVHIVEFFEFFGTKWCYMYNFQCTFILTFYHGVPKIPQEFWHRRDLSSGTLVPLQVFCYHLLLALPCCTPAAFLLTAVCWKCGQFHSSIQRAMLKTRREIMVTPSHHTPSLCMHIANP